VNTVEKEYAFEVAASNLRFGDGVTAEVGMDLKNMKARKVWVISIVHVFFNRSCSLYRRLEYSLIPTWLTCIP